MICEIQFAAQTATLSLRKPSASPRLGLIKGFQPVSKAFKGIQSRKRLSKQKTEHPDPMTTIRKRDRNLPVRVCSESRGYSSLIKLIQGYSSQKTTNHFLRPPPRVPLRNGRGSASFAPFNRFVVIVIVILISPSESLASCLPLPSHPFAPNRINSQ